MNFGNESLIWFLFSDELELTEIYRENCLKGKLKYWGISSNFAFTLKNHQIWQKNERKQSLMFNICPITLTLGGSSKIQTESHPTNPSLILSIINFIFNQPLSGAWPFERQINRIMPSTLRISASLSFSFFFPRRITATGNEIKRLWLLMLLHSCQGTRSYFFGTKCVSRTFWGLG